MESVNVADSHGDIVHHKNHIRVDNIYDPEVTINFENLELLCIDCHNKEHIWNFTDEGQPKQKHESLLELAGVYRK